MTIKSLISAWRYTCPRCRSAPLFIAPFDLSNPLDMYDNCSHCNQSFEPEPGYYYGAMFISYGLSVMILLPLALLLVFYWKVSVNMAMVIIIFLGVVFFFRLLRFSRALWIHIMVKFNPKLKR